MAKKFKIVNGIRFALDVDTSSLDWDSPADPKLVVALKKKPEVRTAGNAPKEPARKKSR
jgi:hypothetical protein